MEERCAGRREERCAASSSSSGVNTDRYSCTHVAAVTVAAIIVAAAIAPETGSDKPEQEHHHIFP
jgi:hypothetical protein